ncbi:MAG: alpha amylase C-terminal domain-containing protein, partial [Deltaproteobacteria bacterium]|nr:alpha amylase C-terminal domain-containing protein [Deltaproteobacteria bacterium]
VETYLVVVSLNDRAFPAGYWIPTTSLGVAGWREVFNSDASIYGGRNVGNSGQVIQSAGSGINLVIPANGLVVFHRI